MVGPSLVGLVLLNTRRSHRCTHIGQRLLGEYCRPDKPGRRFGWCGVWYLFIYFYFSVRNILRGPGHRVSNNLQLISDNYFLAAVIFVGECWHTRPRNEYCVTWTRITRLESDYTFSETANGEYRLFAPGEGSRTSYAHKYRSPSENHVN